MSKITPIIFIVFSIILFWKYIDPARVEIKALSTTAGEYSRVLERAEDFRERRANLQKEYSSISPSDLIKIKNMVPDDEDNKNVKLILDIDRMASKRGVSLKSPTISDSSSKSDSARRAIAIDTNAYGTTKIGFSVSTTYNTFLLLLGDLENSLRLVDVTDLKVKPGENGVNEYSVSVNTYWLK